MSTVLEQERSQKSQSGEKIFSPEEVRKILNSDNQEIKRLCKQVCISPKKDNATGMTFFLKNDVEILKKIKELHEKGQKIMEQHESSNNTALAVPYAQKPIEQPLKQSEISALVNAVSDAKETIIDRVSKIIDEKLDGMDEVVVELIKCKAENERLKQKLNQMTKDNHKLKNELDSFAPVRFGLYMKKKVNRFGSVNLNLD